MAVIDVSHFKKSFDGKSIHQDVSFKVEKGECMGLIGGSGVGKSVILRSLIGLEKPDSGDILIDGENISGYTERQLYPIRRKVAYVFQGGALFDSMTVFENLAYPLREHTDMGEDEIKNRIQLTLNEFGLGGSSQKFPSQLSGGMQKRVGLARAIILKPQVILYDEPTAGLDPFNTRKIQEMILELKKQGSSAILVTHDMETAFAVCDRIALLSDGRIKGIDDQDKSNNDMVQKFIKGERT